MVVYILCFWCHNLIFLFLANRFSLLRRVFYFVFAYLILCFQPFLVSVLHQFYKYWWTVLLSLCLPALGDRLISMQVTLKFVFSLISPAEFQAELLATSLVI
jgi:hypothetical protein